MENLTLAKILTLTAMAGVGVAAPVAVWAVNNASGVESAQLTAARSFGESLGELTPAATSTATVVLLEPTVIALQTNPVRTSPVARARTGPPVVEALSDDGPRKCRDQSSETFAYGAVRVCDVDRTVVKRGSGFFGAIEKPTRLAPRDLPSPSGILEGS